MMMKLKGLTVTWEPTTERLTHDKVRFIAAHAAMTKAARALNPDYCVTISNTHGTIINRWRSAARTVRYMCTVRKDGKVVRQKRYAREPYYRVIEIMKSEAHNTIEALRGSVRRYPKQANVHRSVRRVLENYYLGSAEVGWVHATPGQIYHAHLLRRTKVFLSGGDVKPNTPERWVGVEIECATNLSHEKLALLMADKGGLGSYVRIKYDGSLRNQYSPVPDEFPASMTTAEITVCAPRSIIESVLVKVNACLTEAGVKVNRRCGLHVHLDQRDTPMTDIMLRYRRLVSAQHVLFAMQPKSRQDNQYCRKSTTRELVRGSSRYFGVNGQSVFKHQTIELRMHSGTTDTSKIMNWIGIVESICYSDKEAPKRGLTRVESLAKYFGTDSRLVEYAVMRARKFKNNAEDAVEATAAGA